MSEFNLNQPDLTSLTDEQLQEWYDLCCDSAADASIEADRRRYAKA